jgi:hypothetical protein
LKANDNIPRDEMLLAEAIAAAKARGMKWCRGSAFEDADGNQTTRSKAARCCALGALALADVLPGYLAISGIEREVRSIGINTGQVFYGNDFAGLWTTGDVSFLAGDKGESLGWAYRCAMTQEDS